MTPEANMSLGKIVLATLIVVGGFVWWGEVGPAGGPVFAVLGGGIWLLVNVIRYARQT